MQGLKPGGSESRAKGTAPIGLGSFSSAQVEKTSGNNPEQQFLLQEEGQQWHLQASLINSAKETAQNMGKQTLVSEHIEQ